MTRKKGSKDKKPRKSPTNKIKIKRTSSNSINSLKAKRIKNV